jgi:hypothetical protein
MFAEMPLDNRTVGTIHAPWPQQLALLGFFWNVTADETI